LTKQSESGDRRRSTLALVPQTDDSAEVAAWPANLHAVAVARRRGVRRRHHCRTPNSIAGKNLMTC